MLGLDLKSSLFGGKVSVEQVGAGIYPLVVGRFVFVLRCIGLAAGPSRRGQGSQPGLFNPLY